MKIVLVCLLGLVGCSGATIKKQIYSDLNLIVQQNADCPTFCAAMKFYIQTHLQ